MATYAYTFTSGDTVTPTKLNNARTVSEIVNADIKSDAAIAGSKLADNSVTQAKLAAGVAGNGPAFRAYASGTTSIPNNIATKVNLATESYDTDNNFASSRFTPTVAGYYQINGAVYISTAPAFLQAQIFKNGSLVTSGPHTSQPLYLSNCADLIFMNGSTDYLELYALQTSGTTHSVTSGSNLTFMSGFLARAA